MKKPVWALLVLLLACGKTVAPVADVPEAKPSASAKPAAKAAEACAAGLTPAARDSYTALAVTNGGGCALHESGRVACWGAWPSGAPGCQAPAWREGVAEVASIRSGGIDGFCAQSKNGETSCWGYGPWVAAATSQVAAQPVRAKHLDGATLAMATSSSDGQHACAIAASGKLSCWGYGALGQLGRAGGDATFRPAAVVMEKATAVAAGPSHTCAIDPSGGVVCWGYGEGGALGDGDLHERPCSVKTSGGGSGTLPGHYRDCEGPAPVFGPRSVAGVGEATALAAGRSTTCVITGGTVMCWGGVFGPKPNSLGLAGTVEIAGSGGLFCARTATGTVSCFGKETSGRLVKTTPKVIPTLEHATAIAVTENRACAVVEGGTIRCWGNNASGLALTDWTAPPP
jgi:alpha-tubulin suppressor-like RCC1 family protein